MATPKIELVKLFTYLDITFNARQLTPKFPFKYLGISNEQTLETDGNFSMELPSDAVSSETEGGINANYMTTYKININFLESAKIDLKTEFNQEDSITYFLVQTQKIIQSKFSTFQVAPTIQSFYRNLGSENTEKQRLLYKVALLIYSANNVVEDNPQ